MQMPSAFFLFLLLCRSRAEPTTQPLPPKADVKWQPVTSSPRMGKLRHGCECCTSSPPHLEAHEDAEKRWMGAPRAPSRSHFAPQAALAITGAAHCTPDPFSDPEAMGLTQTPPGSPPPWGTSLPGAPSHKPIARTGEEVWKLQLGKKTTRATDRASSWGAALSQGGNKGILQSIPFPEGNLMLLKHPKHLVTPKYC